MTKSDFIENVAECVVKYAHHYGIEVHSPIIAQAILESGWGESTLSKKYHNYFGLKCGTAWKGASVNMTTKEEYTVGVHTTIKDNFRVYGSLEEGVKGYFDFIQLERYQNLRGITDAEEYLKTIKADGYCTSSTYVDNCMKLIRNYGLSKYDIPDKRRAYYRSRIVSQAQSWVGRKAADGSHKLIIDTYNNDRPLPVNYKVKYTDAWCATFVSACAIAVGYKDIIPKECSCPRQIELWKKLGRWEENDNYKPSAGDIIYYDWDDNGSGDCKGVSDHVGIVEKVEKNVITVIEGNKGNAVGRRQIGIGARYIRGYGLPAYTADELPVIDRLTASEKPCISLQNALNNSYGCDLKVNGKYNLATKTAVKKHLLQKGVVNEHVLWLQEALNAVGYKLEEDSSFGPVTMRAVADYQGKNGWKITGTCGKKVTKKLVKTIQHNNSLTK